jgi:eukaryotic-like serine/threonine-protein kinase
VLDARYRIERKVGEGGMAYVYLASELATGERFAIKVLSPRLSGDQTSVERLKREAGMAMRLDHPNICRILRLGQSPDGLIYLVMPFLDGEVLNDREARTGQFSLIDGLPLLVQVCRGLQHAHDLGILHRDLKPENVILVPDPEAPGGHRAVVMDFGLAKELVQDPARRKLTTTGIVLGTPEFMSPEQIRGKPLDARSDIYALGILAFELFAGDLPFDGGTSQDKMIARLRGQPTMLRTLRPDLPPRLEAALARALAMDPANRFPTMDAFGDALEAVIEPGLLARLFRR